MPIQPGEYMISTFEPEPDSNIGLGPSTDPLAPEPVTLIPESFLPQYWVVEVRDDGTLLTIVQFVGRKQFVVGLKEKEPEDRSVYGFPLPPGAPLPSTRWDIINYPKEGKDIYVVLLAGSPTPKGFTLELSRPPAPRRVVVREVESILVEGAPTLLPQPNQLWKFTPYHPK